MIIYLDFEVVRFWKYFRVKLRLFPYKNPQNMVKQQILDKINYCKIPFGALDQANNDNNTTNSIVLQTIGGIYLLSLDKIQGGHVIFHLHSHIVIDRRNIIEIPIPKAINKHIEEKNSRT